MQGLVPMPGSNGETSTRGLETLASECKQYRQQGARFTKWRAALKVADDLPSDAAIQRNAQELAEYAAIAQVLFIGQDTCKSSLTPNNSAAKTMIGCLLDFESDTTTCSPALPSYVPFMSS